MTYRKSIALLVLCLLAAAALRLPNLSEVPPGLHYDEAANGILAGDIGLRGDRPVFIASYTGKEVLFFYLAGGLMRLIGESAFALRVTAAFVGLLTVAAAAWLGRELFRDRRVALLAAALLAVAFWHVVFSRLGFRAITQPLLQALTVAALWRGLRTDSRPWLAAAGAGLGLTLYTYLAARFFPVALALGILPMLWARDRARHRRAQLALVAVVAAMAFLPLLAYFAAHPAAFWVRAGQVLAPDAAAGDLLNSYVRALGMFFVAGDPYWRFNVPGRPIFDFFWAAFFVAGWLLAVWRARPQPDRLRQATYLLLAVWPAVMILPSALAVNEIVPSNLRTIGLLPFVFYFPALALTALLDRAGAWIGRRRASGRAWRPGAAAAVAAVLILTAMGVAAYRTVFQDWAGRADLFYESDGDLVAVARYLNQADTADRTIFVAAAHYRHPTIAFLSDGYETIKWLPGGTALVFPAGGSATLLFPHQTPAPDWAAEYLRGAARSAGPEGPDGEPLFVTYAPAAAGQGGGPNGAAAGPAAHLDHPVNVNFGNQISLLGYEAGSGPSGGFLPLTLAWRVDRKTGAELMPFVHLQDAWGYRWSQVESFAYPAEQWLEGDLVVQRIDVPLPAGTPPGSYRLRVGFFSPSDGEALAVLDEAGRYAGNAYTIDNAVALPGALPEKAPRPAHDLNLPAGPHLTLLGYDLPVTEIAAGAPLDLALYWQASGALGSRILRLELLGPGNTGRILASVQPVHDTYPFADWSPPMVIIDRQSVRLPVDLPAGRYAVSARLLGGVDETMMVADLGAVEVTTGDRLFVPPRTAFPAAARFGDAITLLGYDLAWTAANTAELALVWQAEDAPAENYTVFVHLLSQDGTCCLWQADRTPQAGRKPTSGWVLGEVVVDTYLIEVADGVAAGSYPLEIGLYRPETGQRLQVTVPGQRPSDALELRPLVVEPAGGDG